MSLELINLTIAQEQTNFNFGLDNSVTVPLTVYATGFDGTPVANYPITVTSPDDSRVSTVTGSTNSNGVFTYDFTFLISTATGVPTPFGLRRLVVNGYKNFVFNLYRDTDWFNALTYTGIFSDKTDYDVMMRVKNDIVQISGSFTNSSAFTTNSNGTGTKIGTLKYTKFAPNRLGILTTQSVASYKYMMEITTVGECWMSKAGWGNTTNTSIPKDSWITFVTTYMI